MQNKNSTRRRDLTRPENIYKLWETDIHYIFPVRDGMENNLILRTDNGPQYIAKEFKKFVRYLGIKSEYIQKHTPEDNCDIESFHKSLKTDCICVNDIESFEDGQKLMEYAFNDYNSIRPHSSSAYYAPDEFEKSWNEDKEFRNSFIEDKKKKEERIIKNR